MKEEIINNLENPKYLEKLFREDKTSFRKTFNEIYLDIKDNPVAQVWNERLNFENEEISWGNKKDLIFTIGASVIAGLLAKIPAFTSIKEDFFYLRNIAFIVLPLMTVYFLWKQKANFKNIIICSIAILLSAIYINILPVYRNSDIFMFFHEKDTIILACIHLPLFLWAVLGFSFVGNNLKNYRRRLDFLRFNGDLVVMTTIILIAGAVLTGVTVGLFDLINIKIHNFYFPYIVVWGLAASPIVGTYLVRTNPQIVNKVSPVIAKVFTPLALATLIVYLSAIIITGKSPYKDREFLIVFNMLLIGVMAIIFFSIAETSKNSRAKIGTVLILALALLTVIVNGTALSAIVYRIFEWGITPNRLAVLGSNILFLTNLIIITYRLFKAIKDINQIEKAEKSIAVFLPVYAVWTMIVTFLFPVMFNFK